MRIFDLNWMQLEAVPRARRPDRAAARLDRAARLPLARHRRDPGGAGLGRGRGAARRAGAARARLRRLTPRFTAYPGRPSIGLETYVGRLGDLIGSLREQGFRRVLLVNGHGGNSPAAEHVAGDGVLWHDWWRAPQSRRSCARSTRSRARVVDRELPVDAARRRRAARPSRSRWSSASGSAGSTRRRRAALLGDGSFGGAYDLPGRGHAAGLARRASRRFAALLEDGWA